MGAKHLTEEALMLLAGNRLSPEDTCLVKQHLKECLECRECYDRMYRAHTVFESLSQLGLNEISELASKAEIKPRKVKYSFPWRPVTALVLGCVCVAVLFFELRSVPVVSATELLANAVHNERQEGALRAFRAAVGGTPCAAGRGNEQLVSLGRSADCARALQSMKNSRWGQGNPLSAETFRTWHDSLHNHRDKVIKQQALWQIVTETNEGPVHSASLRIRASNYRPTELTLQFEDDEELTISEDTQPLPKEPAEMDKVAAAPKVEREFKHNDDPADLLEVTAWKVLHELKADSGWEAVVVRSGPEVVVKAIVKEEDRRKELLRSFGQYPEIGLDIHLVSDPKADVSAMPKRKFVEGDGPPLASKWLGEHFPDDESRMTYVNETLRLSQKMLGRAFFVDKLQQRQIAMSRCSCAKDLSELLNLEQVVLVSEQAEVASALQPLIGSPDHPPLRPMDFMQANNLDIDIQELIGQSSDQASQALEACASSLRGLL